MPIETPQGLTPVMSCEDVEKFLDRDFPQIHAQGRVIQVRSIASGEAVVRLTPNEHHLRPGNTISGPTLFTLADVGAYIVILAHIGPVALAVTTNLTINFLQRPPLAPLLANARLLKLGRRLAVTEIGITSEAGGDLLAHATATYSIPPDR